MNIPRALFLQLREKLIDTNKIVILYGARQVGKTTLVNRILDDLSLRIRKINADEKKYVDVLSSRDFNRINRLISGYDGIFIDEAQRIPDIGINLKIIHDRLPEFKIIVTGSSSFDLANNIQEPLTGRTWTYTLFPISFYELQEVFNPFDLHDKVEDCLTYGLYPELFSYESHQDLERYLRELSTAYLYKDILEVSSIKHSNKLHDLLRLLAFQIGSEVSMAELGRGLQMSKDTVETYIDLLEKSFVLYRLPGFSRNLRKEVTKMDKIYFYDLGIRNIVIENLNPLKYRNDQGALWENFLVIERMKLLHYSQRSANQYYWRTYTGAELDYIEETSGEIHGYEFKYGKKAVRCPKSWQSTYPSADFTCINQENYFDFILDQKASVS